MQKSCFNCGNPGSEFYGYNICESCKTKLAIFTDKTIMKHKTLYNKKGISYEDEINRRLIVIEKEYIKKRIKLLDILSKSKSL